MAEVKNKTKKSLRKVSAIEIKYAQMICLNSDKTRLKIYRKLASLMANRFSLMDALELLYNGVSNNGKNPFEPMAIAITSWMKVLQNGLTFADALKGWAPGRERLMLSTGDVSNLESALLNLIKVTEGSTKMIRPIIGAIAYPAFLMMMSVLIIYAIGVYMVPPMQEAAPGLRWTGVAADLVGVSEWIQVYWAVAFAALPVIMITIYATIGIWTGKLRVVFDRFPPWSLYKIFIGVSWLLAMAALIKGGTPVSSSMSVLRRDANAYLRERIDKALRYINNGDNLGQALYKSETEFPDKELLYDENDIQRTDKWIERCSQEL
jgi:type II secretory pathway component PulF